MLTTNMSCPDFPSVDTDFRVTLLACRDLHRVTWSGMLRRCASLPTRGWRCCLLRCPLPYWAPTGQRVAGCCGCPGNAAAGAPMAYLVLHASGLALQAFGPLITYTCTSYHAMQCMSHFGGLDQLAITFTPLTHLTKPAAYLATDSVALQHTVAAEPCRSGTPWGSFADMLLTRSPRVVDNM